jgi:trehalose 6-phosphate phosphatase
MNHILSHNERRVLAQYAWSNMLLALDYDGTLSPIARNPAKARMRTRTKKALELVARRYPTAVISGRGRRDVAALLEGVPLVAILGNHGLESAEKMEPYENVVSRWVPLLHDALDGVQGVSIEDKTYSLAIHYRRSRSPRSAVRKIRGAVASLEGDPRVIGGKCVINVIPPGAPHKGLALERLRDEQRADKAVFIGDDLTDEDVFELDQPEKVLGIRVGQASWSSAPYYLRDQSEVDQLLEFLVRLRPEK